MLSRIRYLKNHSEFMRYFKNTSWLFAEKGLSMTAGLFVGIWVARFMGPEKYGLYSYVQAFVMLFAVIAPLGLDRIVVKNLVQNKEERDSLLGTSFILKFMSSWIVILLITAGLYFTKNSFEANIYILIISFSIVFQSFNVIDFYFQSQVRSKYKAIASIVTLIISSGIKIALVLLNARLVYFVGVLLLESVLTSIGLMYFYHKTNLSIKSWSFSFNGSKKLLKESWPLLLASMASIINMRVDQVMLGNLVDNVVVGNYAAAVRVSELWLVIPALLGSSIFPAIIKAKDRGVAVYRKSVLNVIKYMSIFAFPTALLISINSKLIIRLLFGEQFVEAGSYLAISIWSGVPFIVLFILSQVYVLERLTKYNFYVAIFMVLSNVTLNTIMIPKYGGIGAAFSSLLVAYSSNVLSVLILFIKTNKYLRLTN